MKFVINNIKLVDAISRVAPAADRTPGMPTSNAIHIAVAGSKAAFTTSGHELSLRRVEDVRGEVDGEAVVALQPLIAFAKAMPSGSVTLESTGGNVVLSCGSTRMPVPAVMSSGFENITFPKFAESSMRQVSVSEIAGAFNDVAFAASSDDTRPALKGVLFEAAADHLVMVATDATRLSYAKVDSDVFDDGFRRVVPAKAMRNALDALAREAEVKFCATDNALQFVSPGTKAIVRTIGLDFPKVEQILNAATPTSVTVERDQLAAALMRARLLAQTQDAQAVRLRIDSATGTVRIGSARAGDTQDSDVVPAQITGESVTFACNARLVEDALGAIGTQNVQIGVAGELQPFVVRPADETSSNRHVVMPLRV